MAGLGSGLIGALRVDLGINTAPFAQGLSKGLSAATKPLADFAKVAKLALGGEFAAAGKQLGTFGTSLRAAVIPLTAIATSALSGLAIAIKGAINEADDMGKAAQKFGLPVEELSRLNYAAKLSDVSLETLGNSLGILSRNMVQAAEGGKKASAGFDSIGVAVTNADGSMRSTSAVLLDISTKFAATNDNATKTALAMALMGKGGKEMIPFLNEGGHSLKELGDEAERLGRVIDADTAAAAERFNDDLTRLSESTKGLVTQLMTHVVPALADVADAVVWVMTNFQNLPAIANEVFNRVIELALGFSMAMHAVANSIPAAFVAAFKAVVHAAATAFTAVPGSIGEKILKPLQDADAALANFETEGTAKFTADMDAAGAVLSNAMRPLESVIPVAHGASAALGDLGTSFANAGGAGGAGKAAKGFEKAANAIEKQIAVKKAELAAQALLNPLVSDYGAAEERARVEAELLTAAEQARIPITDALRQRIAGLANGMADVAVQGGLLDESQQRVVDSAQTVGDVGEDVTGGLISGLIEAKNGADLLSEALGKVGNRLIEAGLDAIFQPQSAGSQSLFSTALKAFGIPGFANGVHNFRGGLARINERGGELINLPRGAQVIPHDLSAKMAGGGEYTFAPVYNIQGADAAQVAQLRQENQRSWDQFRGNFRGDVQRAVGDRRNLGRI